MKKRLRKQMETKRYRIKRKWNVMLRETLRIVTLLSMAAGFAVVLVYAYNFLICAPYFQIRHIVVRGCDRIEKKEIVKSAGVDTSQNILAVNLGEFEEKVRKLPWVGEVSVGRELPNRLVFEIDERKPVALIRKAGELYLVDGTGNVFLPYRSGDSMDLPVMNGFYEKGELKEELLRSGIRLLAYLKNRVTYPMAEDVSEISANEVYGFTIITCDRLLLDVGFDNYEGKFERFEKVVNGLERQGGEAILLGIDLTYNDRIIVLRRKVSGRSRTSNGYRT